VHDRVRETQRQIQILALSRGAIADADEKVSLKETKKK